MVSDIVKYMLICIAFLLLLCNVVLHIFAGVTFWLVNPLRLEVYHLHVRGKCDIGSLRFSPRRKKIIIENLKVFNTNVSQKDEQKTNEVTSIIHPKEREYVDDGNFLRLLKKYLPLLLKILNGLSIEITSTGVEDIHLDVEDIRAVLRYQCKSEHLTLSASIRGTKWILQSICQDFSLNITTKLAPHKLGLGIIPIENTVVDMKAYEVLIPMDFSEIMKSLAVPYGNDSMSNDHYKDYTRPDFNDRPEEAIKRINLKLGKLREVIDPVSELNMVIDKITVRGVSTTRISELQKLDEALTYNFYASTIKLEIGRFRPYAPGFRLLFANEDTPLKIGMTISNFAVSFQVKRKKLVKVLETPSICLFGSSNLLSQEFDLSEGSMLENALLNLKCNVLSPIFDIDTNHLSFYKSFQENIGVFTRSLENTANTEAYVTPSDWKKCSVFLFFKRCLPLIDFKFSLEDSRLLVSDGNDMLVCKLTELLLRQYSERNLSPQLKDGDSLTYNGRIAVEVLGVKFEHLNKIQNYEKEIASLESASLRLALNLVPKLLLSSSADLDSFCVDVSDLPTMIALNNIFRKLDVQMADVERNYFVPLYEKFHERLHVVEKRTANFEKDNETTKILPSSFVFKELPPFFDFIKLSLNDVSISVGCRSVFMPPDVFSNIDAQSPEDLVNGKLRKLCYQINKIELVFFGIKTQFLLIEEGGKISMVKSSPNSNSKSYGNDILDNISESNLTDIECLWNLNLLIDGVSLLIIAESSESVEEVTTRKVFELSSLSLNLFPDLDSGDSNICPKLRLKCEARKIFSVTSLMFGFLIISGVHTLKQIFGHDITLENDQSTMKTHFIVLSRARQRNFFNRIRWSQIKELIEIEFHVDRFNQVMDLPNGLKTRLEFYSVFVTLESMDDITFTGEYSRFCVESPTAKKYWVHLITILNFKVLACISKTKMQAKRDSGSFAPFEPSVILENESWHFSIPFQFEMHRLFDNFSTVVKSFKQMMYSFKTCKNHTILFPRVTEAPALPKIKLKSQRMKFTLEDDPLEAELSIIFQVGLKEQKIRFAKLQEFEEQIRIELVRNDKNQRLSNQATTSTNKEVDVFSKLFCFRRNSMQKKRTYRRKLSPKIAMPFNIDEIVDEDDVKWGKKANGAFGLGNSQVGGEDVILRRAVSVLEKLEENFSASWIGRIKQFKRTQKDSFYNDFCYLWGNIDYSRLPPDMNYRVLPFSPNPFLSTITVEEIDIDIFQPSFGMDGIADFIYDVGKKVPRNTPYSTLLPMYLDAKFQEVRWHLRDYPLPFIYVPRLDKSQADENNSIHIYGDFVIGEDIIQSEKELRTLFIPLIPSIILENTDRYYSLLIPRSIGAVKSFMNLKLDINSVQTTQVTWGGGYQPAIQQTMQCFDNFSKPPSDPSGRVGLWDKLRYLFHARIKIAWKNHGRFEVGLKGGTSPHKIGTDAAGFLVGFHKNVVLTVNEDDDPKKFISCSADELYFSIPNYFAKPLLVWSRPSSQTVFVPIHTEPTLQDYAFFYYLCGLDTTSEAGKHVRTMELHYIEKTAIKLTGGVTLNIGTTFERLVRGSSSRTFDSVPHYRIRLSNPVYVPDISNHDSYAGFRSDFIHLSFTLLSTSCSAYNILQLSPAGLMTFLKWWKSFAGNFPVRSGPLFGLQSIGPKFGEHLRTISYRANVSPLFVSYTAHSFETSRLTNKGQSGLRAFVGIKAKATKLVMDLHQRKEVLITFQEELNRTKQIMAMNFLGGEVLAKKLDIRTVQGNFRPMKSREDKKSGVFEVYDDDMAWYDVTDFKEAYSLGLENYVPSVCIKPFLYTPHFVYLKRASYGDKYQLNPKDHMPIPPFKNDVSHYCTLGQTQLLDLDILKQRLRTLRDLKSKKSKGDADANKNDFMRRLNLELEKAQHLFEDFSYMQKHKAESTDSHQYHYELPNLMKESSADSYEHRYCVNCPLLNWNEDTRNALFKFLHYISLAHQFSLLTATKSLQIIEDVIKQKTESVLTEEVHHHGSGPIRNPTKQIDADTLDEGNLDCMLSKFMEKYMTGSEIPVKHILRKNHFVEFLNPQIQLLSNEDPDFCVMLTSSGIKMEVVSFDGDLNGDEYKKDAMLRRYGIQVVNSNVFHFDRNDFMHHSDTYFDGSTSAYGQVKGTSWPPWLALELSFDCNHVPEEAIIVKNLSFNLYYDKLSEISSYYSIMKDRLQNKLSGYFPKLSISADSKTYASVLRLVKNLFCYSEPESAELKKQIDKLSIGFDLRNVTDMRNAIQDLHESLRMLSTVESAFSFKRQILDYADKVDFQNVYAEKIHHLLKLYILMQVFISNRRGSDNGENTLLWDFNVCSIGLYLLTEKINPFLNINIEGVHLKRLQSFNGFNNNKIVASTFYIRDARRGVIYQNIMGPIDLKHLTEHEKTRRSPLLSIDWQMDEPVGGIKVAKNVDTRLAGLCLNLEDELITKVIDWFLPDELKNVIADKDDNSESVDESADLASVIAGIEESNVEGEVTLNQHGDLNEMVQRSSDFLIIENLVLNTFKVCVSFRGKAALRLANVTNFVYNFPTLKLQHQTMKVADLLIILKKVLIKDLLKHTGRFLGAKVIKRKPHSQIETDKESTNDTPSRKSLNGSQLSSNGSSCKRVEES